MYNSYPSLLLPESIVVVVVSGFKLHVHQVDCSDGGGEEEDFHGGVVQGDEVGEQVQVAGQKHQGKQHLRTAWNLREIHYYFASKI